MPEELGKYAANKMKDDLAETLNSIYLSRGIDALTDKIYGILENCKQSKYPVSYRNQIKGECTEILLQASLMELQKSVQPSISVKGLCFTKAGTDKTTELDVTFFTPYCVYLFECKCYAGAKTLTQEGVLTSQIKGQSRTIDVFSQSAMHVEYLNSRVGQFHLSTIDKCNPPYKMVLVDGSDGTMTDKREARWKQGFPVVNIDDISDWCEREFRDAKSKKIQWNLKSMNPVLKDISEHSDAMMKKHLFNGGKQ